MDLTRTYEILLKIRKRMPHVIENKNGFGKHYLTNPT